MAPKHKTARGQPIDMARLRDLNAYKPALGNANSNARGDIINKKGVVLKTQEQITAEIEATKRRQETNTKQMNIKSDGLIPDLNNKPVIQQIKPKEINVEDQNFDPISEALPDMPEKPNKSNVHIHTRRKITETDN